MPRRRLRGGFTLTELLVVIAIIALLLMLLLPSVQGVREAARRTHCANTLKQLALACLAYETAEGTLPPGTYRSETPDGGIFTVTPSWIARILPHVEQKPLHDRIDWQLTPGDTGANAPLKDTPLPLVRCPSDPATRAKAGWAPTNYVACVGDTDLIIPWLVPHPGAFFIAWDPAVPVPPMTNGQPRPMSVGGRPLARIRDGLANTLLLSECVVNWPFIKRYSGDLAGYGNCLAGVEPPLTDNQTASGGRGKSWFMGTWSQDWTFTTHFPPNDALTQGIECELWTHQGIYGARSRHPGVVNAAFADGSVRGVTDAVDVVTWRGLGTVAGRETASPAW